MTTTRPASVRRLVLIRPAHPSAPGVRRLLLARRGDALLPAPRSLASRPPPRG